ncbi:MAG: exodeoxyribonuclease V subunit gamma [Eubacteriales bacterium]|nr:exodeoxyribonuclease V subunit gamma [Eubacteriales bacterium]
MSLRIIYGRAGSGKREFCFDLLKQADSTNKYIYIIPEQFSQESERQVASMGKSAFISVMSFGRLAHHVFSRLGPVGRRVIDEESELMLAQNALMTVANKLRYLSVSASNTDFASQIIVMATEFKRHLITPDVLTQAAENIKDPIFRLKLEEIALIYKVYCELVEKAGGSEADNLTLLKRQIENSDIFYGENIIINHFEGFTPQEMDIISLLLSRCETVTVSMVSDKEYSDTINIFSETRNTIYKLKNLAKESNIKIDDDVYLGECKKYQPNSALAHCEREYFKYPPRIYHNEPSDIKIHCTKNIYSEVETAAITILRMCREDNMRMRDIVLAVRNGERYHSIIKQVFDKMGIPYFISEDKTVLSHPLTNAAISMFSSAMNNFPTETVMSYIKSGFAQISREERNLLENYVIAAGINRNKWTSEKGFGFVPQGFEDYHKEIIDAKNRVIAPIIEFTDTFKGRKTATEISKAYYKMLHSSIRPSAEKEMERLVAENKTDQADNLRMAWSGIVRTIERMSELIGDENITLEKYHSIFIQGLATCGLITPPPFADRVLVCSPEGYRSNNPPVFMLLGAVDGALPASHKIEGLLSDNERDQIAKMGVTLAKTTYTKLMDEQYLIYNCLTAPSKLLYISYPIANDEGDGITPSPVIGRLKTIMLQIKLFGEYTDDADLEGEDRVFSKLMIHLAKNRQADGMWAGVDKWFRENRLDKYENAIDALNYTNIPKKLSQKSLDILYPQSPYTSISRLEGYSRCQFAHFIQYGMRVKPRKEYELQAVDTGSLMHEVMEEFSKDMLVREGGWLALSREYCDAKVDQICDKAVRSLLGDISLGSKRFDYLAKSIKRTMKTVVWNVAEFYKNGDFIPFGYELSFGDGVLPPLDVTLDDGRVIHLVGKIDRVDVLESDNGRHFSIVDYKSSKKVINYGYVKAGLQIQLPVYLDAICNAFDGERPAIPGALLYYHLADPMVTGLSTTDDEKIKSEVTKELRMRGIIATSETALSSFKTTVVGNSALPTKYIHSLCDFTNRKIKEILGEMLHGSINIHPFRYSDKTGCDYCPYKTICKFDTDFKNNRYKNVRSLSEEEFYANVD